MSLLQEQTLSSTPLNDVSANSFSLTLQNVIDEIPQGRFPHSASPELELVSEVAHDDVHSQGVEKMPQDSRNVRVLGTSVAAVRLPSSVEHVNVHEKSEFTVSASVTEMSPSLAQLSKSQTDVSTNSFNLALQYVIDEIPNGRLPQLTSPVLDLVTAVAYDDVHSNVVEQTLSGFSGHERSRDFCSCCSAYLFNRAR